MKNWQDHLTKDELHEIIVDLRFDPFGYVNKLIILLEEYEERDKAQKEVDGEPKSPTYVDYLNSLNSRGVSQAVVTPSQELQDAIKKKLEDAWGQQQVDRFGIPSRYLDRRYL